MTYETAMRHAPTTVEEAMEKAFWKWAGRVCLGAGDPLTWEAVARAAEDFRETAVLQSTEKPQESKNGTEGQAL